ncbi:MAG: hypothetical protein ACRDPK_06745 [Carbonactinosporaceae bacterium]
MDHRNDDPLDRAREYVAKARRVIPPVTPAVAERAARLLDAVWCAGLRYDVDPEDWDRVTELAGACIDVMRRQTSPRVRVLDV